MTVRGAGLTAMLLALAVLETSGCRLVDPEQTEPSAEPGLQSEPGKLAEPVEPAGHDASAAAAAREQAERVAPEASPPPEHVRVVYPGQSLGHLATSLRESVVTIRATTKVKGGPASMYPGAADDTSLGSGFIIDEAGHVLTNDHILPRAAAPGQARQPGELRIVVAAPGKRSLELPARVVGRAPEIDVALLAIQAERSFEPAPLGDSAALQVGEWVVALGNPFGRELTASAGIISSLDGADGAPLLDASADSYRALLVTDARIHPGNSGGPLVDTAGRVVGINVALDPRGAGLGFAVPIDQVEDILPMLKRDGRFRRSWLGVRIHPVEPAEAERQGLDGTQGALVSEVVAGSPAERAGIRAGDIIVRYDGRIVDHRNLPWLAAMAGGNRRIPVIVWRDRGEHALTLTSALMPE